MSCKRFGVTGKSANRGVCLNCASVAASSARTVSTVVSLALLLTSPRLALPRTITSSRDKFCRLAFTCACSCATLRTLAFCATSPCKAATSCCNLAEFISSLETFCTLALWSMSLRRATMVMERLTMSCCMLSTLACKAYTRTPAKPTERRVHVTRLAAKHPCHSRARHGEPWPPDVRKALRSRSWVVKAPVKKSRKTSNFCRVCHSVHVGVCAGAQANTRTHVKLHRNTICDDLARNLDEPDAVVDAPSRCGRHATALDCTHNTRSTLVSDEDPSCCEHASSVRRVASVCRRLNADSAEWFLSRMFIEELWCDFCRIPFSTPARDSPHVSYLAHESHLFW